MSAEHSLSTSAEHSLSMSAEHSFSISAEYSLLMHAHNPYNAPHNARTSFMGSQDRMAGSSEYRCPVMVLLRRMMTDRYDLYAALTCALAVGNMVSQHRQPAQTCSLFSTAPTTAPWSWCKTARGRHAPQGPTPPTSGCRQAQARSCL